MPYSIGEVSERTGIAASTLRYYDKEGLLPFVGRTPGGIRVFDDADLDSLRVIDCLKKTGLSIREIKQFMDWCREGSATFGNRLAMFRERRDAVQAQMEELQRALDMIEYKCWYYEAALAAGTDDGLADVPADQLPEKARPARRRMDEASAAE